MSDVSVLSQEYQTAAELSDVLNRALIVLKKKLLGLAGAASIPSENVEQSCASLAGLLEALTTLLASGIPEPAGSGSRVGAGSLAGARVVPSSRASSAALEQVPGAVVVRLRSEHGGDLPYFLDDLRRITECLRQQHDVDCLTPEDLTLLEGVASAAEAEASTVYRRLMRT